MDPKIWTRGQKIGSNIFLTDFFWTTNFQHGVKELALGIDLGRSEGSFLDPKISTLGQRMGSNL